MVSRTDDGKRHRAHWHKSTIGSYRARRLPERSANLHRRSAPPKETPGSHQRARALAVGLRRRRARQGGGDDPRRHAQRPRLRGRQDNLVSRPLERAGVPLPEHKEDVVFDCRARHRRERLALLLQRDAKPLVVEADGGDGRGAPELAQRHADDFGAILQMIQLVPEPKMVREDRWARSSPSRRYAATTSVGVLTLIDARHEESFQAVSSIGAADNNSRRSRTQFARVAKFPAQLFPPPSGLDAVTFTPVYRIGPLSFCLRLGCCRRSSPACCRVESRPRRLGFDPGRASE